MRLRLRRVGRPGLMVSVGALLGGVLVLGIPQVPALIDHRGCSDTVMKAVSTDKPVTGTYACFDRDFQIRLQSAGIDSDGAFALKVGQNGEYHFLRRTEDGGYVYEYDRPTTPHDKFRGALNALGVYRITADIKRGDVGRAWNEKNDFKVAWNEITGATQNPQSSIYTFYLDPEGRVMKVA